MSGPVEVVLVGGGGHAMACLDAADPARVQVVGWVGAPLADAVPVPHLGDISDLPALAAAGLTHAHVAIGDNAARARVAAQVEECGLALATIVAPTAQVSAWATVQAGAAVMHRAVVGPRTRLGAGVIVNTGASVDHDCTLGAFSHVAPGTHLAGGVVLGQRTFLGVGAVVIPRCAVGEGAVVGAGAVVVSDIPADTTVIGVPARPHRIAA